MESLAAYLHLLCVFVLCALLAAEFVLCNEDVQPGHLRLLLRLDVAFLLTALLTLATGLLCALASARGAWFYFSNPLFWAKLVLLVAVTAIAVFPTVSFIRWNRALALGRERILRGADLARVRRFLVSELALLAAIPLVAVLVSRAASAR